MQQTQKFKRLRKLSDSISHSVSNVVNSWGGDKTDHRRRPSFRGGQPVSKEDISHRPDLNHARRELSFEDVALSTPAYVKYVSEQNAIANWHATKKAAQLQANTVPFPGSSAAPVSSARRNLRERPVPVPTPGTPGMMRQASRRSQEEAVRTNASHRLPPQSGATVGTSPTNGPAVKAHRRPPVSPSAAFNPFATGPATAPTHNRTPSSALRNPPSQAEKSTLSKADAHKSYYCSEEPATVRRRGATRGRPSLDGAAPFPPQHVQHRQQQSDGNVARVVAPMRGQQYAPTVSSRHPPPERPRLLNVPFDVSSDVSTCAGSPTSTPAFLPPPPVATTRIVTRMQARMQANLRDVGSARAVQVQVSGPQLTRANSHKAQVVEPPPPSRPSGPRERVKRPQQQRDTRAGGKAKETRTVEVYGVEVYQKERAQALLDEKLAMRGLPANKLYGSSEANPLYAGTNPVAMEKGKWKGMEVDRTARW